MAFQVQRIFLAHHQFQNKDWAKILGAQRYEIKVMKSLFRSDNPLEQVKESELWYLAGAYIRRIDYKIPVVALPNTRVLSPNTPLEIIGIVSTKNKRQNVYQCISAYAQKIAKEEELEFIDLTS
jgi:hypothetical protein